MNEPHQQDDALEATEEQLATLRPATLATSRTSPCARTPAVSIAAESQSATATRTGRVTIIVGSRSAWSQSVSASPGVP